MVLASRSGAGAGRRGAWDQLRHAYQLPAGVSKLSGARRVSLCGWGARQEVY